jgi:chromosome segregation ATPase
MSTTPNSPQAGIPRLIPSRQRGIDAEKRLTSEILRKIGLSQEPSTEQTVTFRIWTALKRVYVQAVQSEQKLNQLQKEISAIKEELIQIKTENNQLKESTQKRQDDFQSLKKLEAIWTEKNLAQAQKIKNLEEKNLKLESFLNKTKSAIHARFDWLKNYQNRLRTYATSLNQEKLKLKSITQQISTELEKNTYSHPFHSMIQANAIETMTTFRQIQTLPSSSRKRTTLETHLRRLEERKVLLESGITFAQEILKNKAIQVTDLIRNENLSQTPPTPPRPETLAQEI